MLHKLLYNTRTTEVDGCAMRLNGAYKNSSLQHDIHLQSIFKQIENQLQRLTVAIKRPRPQSILKKKDATRDNALRALHYLLHGSLYHPNRDLKKAAQMLDSVFEKYGLSVTGKSYASESSLIESLLHDLANPELKSSIAAISGCTENIAALKVAQHDFAQTRISYESEKAQNGILENAISVKKVLTKTINDQLVVYMRALLLIDEENYGAFARTVSQIISDSNELVKKRKRKHETNKSHEKS